MEYQMTETGKAEWERQCRVSDLASGVAAGLHKFFDKRGGPDWFCRARDGTEGVRLNGTFSLDEIGAHIVAELTGQTAADLIGEDFVPDLGCKNCGDPVDGQAQFCGTCREMGCGEK